MTGTAGYIAWLQGSQQEQRNCAAPSIHSSINNRIGILKYESLTESLFAAISASRFYTLTYIQSWNVSATGPCQNYQSTQTHKHICRSTLLTSANFDQKITTPTHVSQPPHRRSRLWPCNTHQCPHPRSAPDGINLAEVLPSAQLCVRPRPRRRHPRAHRMLLAIQMHRGVKQSWCSEISLERI